MKFKVIDHTNKSKFTRSEYLYDKYCINKNLNKDTFIHSLKKAYYKYNAFYYGTNIVSLRDILKPYFEQMFTSLEHGYDIIDIGAGTGESFHILNDLKYKFNRYYFIEPFKSMSDQFNKQEDHRVTIINDYLENLNKDNFSLSKGKVFILCSVLRTMDNIPLFMKSLNNIMNKGDFLFLPIEPNNEYFGKYYHFLKPLDLFVRAKKKIRSKIQNLKNKNRALIIKNSSSLDQAVDYLKSNHIVNKHFSKSILYAVVYYNNHLSWQGISIPDEYNDGFFTIEQIAKDYNFEINFISTSQYLYGISKSMDGIMQKLFPRCGSTITATLIKR